MSEEPAEAAPSDGAPAPAPIFGVSELPPRTLESYAHLWQFETWLRRLVYVQLRALDGDAWESKIKAGKAQGPKAYDKRMTHMPTPEDGVLSFIQLSELQRVVADQWPRFEAYLPPRTIWDAKLEEVMAIRHRIAHFRSLHRDDLERVRQFLRDIDNGFWRFCTNYNNAHAVLPQSCDPVVAHFLPFDLFAWTEVSPKQWARVGHADPSERFSMTVEVLAMPWAKWSTPIAGQQGLLYDVMIGARGQLHLDYRRLLQSTLKLHPHVVHICLDSGQTTLRFTVPACLGEAKLIEIIEGFHEAAQNSTLAGQGKPGNAVQAMADTLPEYILGPQNPLTFLGPDMPCAFFQGVAE
jgi:SAV2148-like HEPN